jgi:hypothetical protein
MCGAFPQELDVAAASHEAPWWGDYTISPLGTQQPLQRDHTEKDAATAIVYAVLHVSVQSLFQQGELR